MPTDQIANSRSAELYERAKAVLPGGVSRNAVLRAPHPQYADHASGCRITDIDGVTRIDFSNNMCSLIHGHACPEVVDAVSAQLRRGTGFTLATEVEVRFAEHLCGRTESFEKLRFVNSGTEAIMACVKAARAFTGRSKIAKAEGAYHGGYDYAEVSQTSTPETWGDAGRPRSVPVVHGTPRSALDDVVVIPFNDPDRAVALLDEHADEIACVLIDLMPHRVALEPASQEFVRMLREWSAARGTLLVLDEVITYRSAYGGLQAEFGVVPDLTALGKIIGGGFPIGAIAGRADVMDLMNPHGNRYLFPHSGTFSANPISTTAGLVAMELFDPPAVERLNALADRAKTGIESAIQRSGARACVTGAGSMFRVHMKDAPPRDFREAYPTPTERARLQTFLDDLFDAGFLMINSGSAALSTPMTETEIDALVDAMSVGFEKIANAD